MVSRVTPFLWFDHQAEQAAKFYTSIFENSKIGKVTRNSKAAPGPTGGVFTVQFWLDGLEFTALNGGPHFTFNEAVSFVVNCETQKELDYYWDALIAGGTPSQCGWLKDRFGLSWQIVPTALPELLSDPDPGRAQRATAAMMKMVKLDLEALRKAADGAA
jgi:predicted 3-demethylubiquinone-9 3-methyltransferase (glyoxalase superfamily)